MGLVCCLFGEEPKPASRKYSPRFPGSKIQKCNENPSIGDRNTEYQRNKSIGVDIQATKKLSSWEYIFPTPKVARFDNNKPVAANMYEYP